MLSDNSQSFERQKNTLILEAQRMTEITLCEEAHHGGPGPTPDLHSAAHCVVSARVGHALNHLLEHAPSWRIVSAGWGQALLYVVSLLFPDPSPSLPTGLGDWG